MKSLYTVLLFSIFNFQFTATKAQTVRVFSKTGIPKGTYSTVAAALATTTDGDSLVLSAHTFKESRLRGNYSVVYQGTISGGDTTTIDAMGNGSVFTNCKGTIRDIVLTGAKYIPPPGSSNGAAILNFEGRITGNTTIRNNEGFNVGGVEGSNFIIDGNVKFINNSSISSVYGKNAGAIYSTNGLSIKGNVVFRGNRGDSSCLIFIGNNGNASKTIEFNIEDGCVFENNSGFRSNAIFVGNGCNVKIKNISIINNKHLAANTVCFFCKIPTESIPYDSIGTSKISIANSRIYNPRVDYSRQLEVFIAYKNKPSKFHSEGCWWGNSDTTGLIIAEAGTDFTMPNWAVAKWYGVPFGTSGSQVRAQMQLNTGAPLPPNCFKGLEGKFSATAGSFPAPTTVINAGNLIASDYYYPASGPFAITASVDADTFRTNNKGALGIAERGFEQFKIYPNPFVSELRAEGLPLYSMIRLYDAQGKMVYYRYAEESQCSLSLGHLPAGQYSLKITSADGQVGSTKLTKE